MQRRLLRFAVAPVAAAAFLLTALHPAIAAPSAGPTIRVSVATDGTQADDMSGRFSRPAISGDGRVTAFDSLATNLVAGDTNKAADVFVHDASTGATERVSISTGGRQGNDDSTDPAVDGDGTVIAFDSSAGNLVRNDANHLDDVFVRDRAANRTIRVSTAFGGGDADGPSFGPAISADGRFVAFVSDATNLVPDDTNSVRDIFVRDLVNKTTELVSLTSDGVQANSSSASPSISADGRKVAFSSFASNLVPDDTNGAFDAFVHNRVTGNTTRISLSSRGAEADGPSYYPAISGDGRFVAFASEATNLIKGDSNAARDVFRHALKSGRTIRVSVANDGSQADMQSVGPGIRGGSAWGPAISADGTRIAFDSIATNLVPGDTDTCDPFYDQAGTCPDVFVRDVVANTTTRVSVATDGSQENHASTDPSIDASGLSVVFFSAASNLVEGDTNVCVQFPSPGHCPDIFVHTSS